MIERPRHTWGISTIALILLLKVVAPCVASYAFPTPDSASFFSHTSRSPHNEPVPLTSQSGLKVPLYSIASGSGSVWAWGINDHGQIGDGTTVNRSVMVQVVGLGSGVVDIRTGSRHTLALKSDGTVWAWGYNGCYQLGDGTNFDSTVPKRVTGLSGVSQIGTGPNTSYAVKSDGSIWAWGRNESGCLGPDIDSSLIYVKVPTQIQAVPGVKSIEGGDFHTTVLKQDGTVWAWGGNYYGQLGRGTFSLREAEPAQVIGLEGIQSIKSLGQHTLALKNDGTVWSWGCNTYGVIGDGTTSHRATPLMVPGLSEVKAISACSGSSMALKADGSIWAWGDGFFDGHQNRLGIPVHIMEGLDDVESISAGAYRFMALKTDGSVWESQFAGTYYAALGEPKKVSGTARFSTAVAAGFYGVAILGDSEPPVGNNIGLSVTPQVLPANKDGMFEITVTTPSGEPLVGAEIRITTSWGAQVPPYRSDAQGKMRFGWHPYSGDYCLITVKSGTYYEAYSFVVGNDGTKGVVVADITSENGIRLTGHTAGSYLTIGSVQSPFSSHPLAVATVSPGSHKAWATSSGSPAYYLGKDVTVNAGAITMLHFDASATDVKRRSFDLNLDGQTISLQRKPALLIGRYNASLNRGLSVSATPGKDGLIHAHMTIGSYEYALTFSQVPQGWLFPAEVLDVLTPGSIVRNYSTSQLGRIRVTVDYQNYMKFEVYVN